MLNKPRGLVTTRRDPQERKTVYDCLPEDLPFVSPVGRLDKASESLLFLTNDTGWAEYLMTPASGISKTYHVKVDRAADDRLLAPLQFPVEDKSARLSTVLARQLRSNGRTQALRVGNKCVSPPRSRWPPYNHTKTYAPLKLNISEYNSSH